jgi:soluble lytic murein transglycosylase-like protein
VDYALLQALIATESGFDAGAVSAKGAIGLMQVIPETATRYGLVGNRRVSLETKLKDPRTNLWTGTRYLRDLLAMFPGDLELALAAYNAGEGAVQKAGNKVPNFPETQNYVKTVMQLYYRLNPQAARQAPSGVTLAAQSESSAVRSATPVNAQAGTLRRGNMVPSVAMPPLGTSDTILKVN